MFAVNEAAETYSFTPSIAAIRLFNEIEDYKKMGGMKSEYLGFGNSYLLLTRFAQIKMKL